MKNIAHFVEIPRRVEDWRGQPSRHWNSWCWLKKNMTTEEAFILRKHPRSIIKAIAYEELLIRNKDIQALLLEIVNDTTSFVFLFDEPLMLSQSLFEDKFNLVPGSPLPLYPMPDISAKIDNLDTLIEIYKVNKKNEERYFLNYDW